jgi:hypothetical protein
LLTVVGAAGLAAVVIQLFVKPILINLIADGKLGDRWYAVFLNLSTFVMASAFVALGVVALGDVSRVTLVQGIITAVLATSLTVGGYEFASNATKLLR